jgi:hypothetical protein
VVDEWERKFRDVDGLVMPQVARNCLREFGGLFIKVNWVGITNAPVSVNLDPSLCLGEKDRWARYEPVIRGLLFPLGEAENGHYFACIDTKGRVYLVMDNILGIGKDFDVAIVHLLLGVAGFPVLA